MPRPREHSLTEVLLDQVRTAALAQHVPVTQYSATVFELHFSSSAEQFRNPSVYCAQLEVTASAGVIKVTFGSTDVLLSPAGETHNGYQTSTDITIPADVEYTITRITEMAIARIVGTVDTEHEILYGAYRLAARQARLMREQGYGDPNWIW